MYSGTLFQFFLKLDWITSDKQLDNPDFFAICRCCWRADWRHCWSVCTQTYGGNRHKTPLTLQEIPLQSRGELDRRITVLWDCLFESITCNNTVKIIIDNQRMASPRRMLIKMAHHRMLIKMAPHRDADQIYGSDNRMLIIEWLPIGWSDQGTLNFQSWSRENIVNPGYSRRIAVRRTEIKSQVYESQSFAICLKWSV